jgi:hypothetical protein
MEARAREVKRLIDAIYPRGKVALEAVRSLVLEAYRSTDDNYGEREAIEWAEGFSFPEALGSRDAEGLARAGGTLEVYVADRHKAMSQEGPSKRCQGR